MNYKPLALAAAALTAGFLSFGAAQAANVMTGSNAPAATTASVQDGNIQLASDHRWRRHRHGDSGVTLGFGLPLFGGGGYYDDYYDGYGYGSGYGYGYAPYRSYYSYAPAGGGGHVRYCMSRYRTYDPRSNTFIGYDGDRHQCRSPYRY
jgi:hypothetical protein